MANPFQTSSIFQKRKDRFLTAGMAVSTYSTVGVALLLFGWITIKGAPVLFDRGLEFFTKNPQTLVVFENEAGAKVQMDFDDYSIFKDGNPDAVIRNEHTHSYSGGGIKGPLLGTALLMVVCMVTALFVGISASIYLSEYAAQGKFVSVVRLAIVNLAGVPSIVYGLFGFAFFCVFPWWPVVTRVVNEDQSIGAIQLFGSDLFLSFQGWGSSLLAGGLTLAIMVLPVIIAACEESLKAVPKGFREASCALGATRWQCIRTAVLPFATPGILTASVLGITRVAGETAPIMFTAAVRVEGALSFRRAGD